MSVGARARAHAVIFERHSLQQEALTSKSSQRNKAAFFSSLELLRATRDDSAARTRRACAHCVYMSREPLSGLIGDDGTAVVGVVAAPVAADDAAAVDDDDSASNVITPDAQSERTNALVGLWERDPTTCRAHRRASR